MRRIGAAAVAAALGAAAVACTSGGNGVATWTEGTAGPAGTRGKAEGTTVGTGPAASPAAFAAAADQTRAAGTGRYRGTVEVEVGLSRGPEAGSLSFGADVAGEFDLPAERSHVTATVNRYRVDGGSSSLSPVEVGDVAEVYTDHRREVSRETFGGTPNLRDGKVWDSRRATPGLTSEDPIEVSSHLAGLDARNQWVRVDVVLDQLPAATTVSDEGHEDVGGVDTSHLRATVPVRALLERARTSGERDQLACASAKIGDLSVTTDLFLDRAGEVRRIVLAGDLGPMVLAFYACRYDGADAAGAPTAATYRYRTSIDVTDLGLPVDITPPDESQINGF